MPSLRKILDLWDTTQLPVSKMAQLTEISESTLRRLKKDPDIGASFETAARIAKALNVSLDELVGIEAAASDPKPSAPTASEVLSCHKSCPLRELQSMHTELYERSIAMKNRWIRILAIACGILMLAWIVLIFIDFTNPNMGWYRAGMYAYEAVQEAARTFGQVHT